MQAKFKHVRRTAGILLAAAMVIGSMAGCSTTQTPAASDKVAPSVSAAASASVAPSASAPSAAQTDSKDGYNAEGLPIVNTPITIKALTTRWGTMGDSFTKNQWLIDLEKKTNVKVEWQVQSLNDWGEQKAILIASQKLPELIIGSQTFGDTDILNNAGLFMDLTGLIEKNMPNLKNAMDAVPEMRKIVTFTDGKIYSLPRKLPSRPQTCNQPIINKKWLDNLGLKAPTTIDELTAVLKAFKDKDANGNGNANDEFPICGAKGLPMDLLNPFGITDLNGTHMMVQDDGSLAYYPIAENYKAGIKWLNDLFKQGIIDPESFTQDNTMQDGKRKNDAVSLVGFDYAWTPDALFGKWASEYVALAPIKGPDGKQYAGGDKNGISSIVRNEVEITAACDKPEIIARWLDQFYDGEASIQNFWGAIGTVITKNSDGTYTLNDPPAGTSADSWYWDQSLRDFGPKYVSSEFQSKIKLSPTSGDGLKMDISKMGDPFITTPYPNVMFTSAESEKLATLTTDINKFVETTRADWVTNGGVDAGWDAYVQQLKSMGLDDMIKIYTDAYARYTQK